MLMLTNQRQILTPEQVKDLFVQPFLKQSVVSQVTTVTHIDSHETRFPIITKDPTASWTAEGEEISPSDPTVSEVKVTPAKVAGLTVASNEMMADMLGEAMSIVGDGLVRQAVNAVDAAFFAESTEENAPAGLGSHEDVNAIEGTLKDLDIFQDAISAARLEGREVTNFVANPTDALKLAKLKEGTNSIRGLLQPDPTQPNATLIEGRRLIVTSHCPEGTIWAIPKDAAFTAIRKDATVESDPSPYFSSDRTAIRTTMRVGFAIVHPKAITKITVGG
ncbi:phage major capsid protein [Corynebacterium hindlerae]|uniref:phage major capsid protein n=1 Tax=Corynebacterium hindlerae TaxID=699041 RepID=UPI003AB0E332